MSDEEYLFLTQGGQRYALPMQQVAQVISDGVYAPVAGARPFLWGVCYRAGRLYPTVSLTGAAAPLGVLCQQEGREAVFLADTVEGLGRLPQQADWLPAEGLGLKMTEATGALLLPQLELLTQEEAPWS